MIVGNAVRISGVKVGSVQEVALDPADNSVRIQMRLNSEFKVPQGSTTEISGIDALGALQMVINPGPSDNPPIPAGSTIPSREEGNILSDLSNRAPALINRVDSVLIGLDATLGHAEGIVSPGSDLRLMLVSLKNTAESLEMLLRQQRERMASVLANVDTLTGELGGLTGEARDSLSVVTENLNRVLNRVDRNLTQLESTTLTLDSIVGKVDRGEGTVGLLVNDASLYHRMDSTVNSMNQLLIDLKENPVRYLRAMRLVDLF
jgi:phospholipid/cholesterol/gamma-HCH transport system substrate-binding protein